MIIESTNKMDETNQFNILLSTYEGPIDLLLDLARKQKVNLSDISILELANQYIDFINQYNKIHLEIAADYLVMAAWLTFLKSRLLLPKEEKIDQYTTEELEEAIKYQLQRLEAMQNISKILYLRPLINRDTFYGGSTEGVKIKYNITYRASLFEMLKNYSYILNNEFIPSSLTIAASELYSVDEAIQRITRMFSSINEWTSLTNLIPKFGLNKIVNKSLITSNFVASLELTKNGLIEIKQNETFGNIFVRSKTL